METKLRMALGASLGAVSQSLGVTPRALRYYEQRGLISVARDRWNCRRYDAATQRQVEIIVRLRCCGLGIDAIAETLDGYRAGAAVADQVLPHLQRRLVEIEAQRVVLLEEIARLANPAQRKSAASERHPSTPAGTRLTLVRRGETRTYNI